MLRRALFACCLTLLYAAPRALTQTRPPSPEPILIDTDIGDDIDDVFAVALALRSPEFQILGFTTAFGDTERRARLLDRLLAETGHSDIPVAAGPKTASKTSFSQAAYADTAPGKGTHQDAVAFALEIIRKHPHAVTLVAIGPLVNIGAMIDKDPEAFRLLKRVVIMGGSVERSSGEFEIDQPRPPIPEWNIVNDISSAQKLFAAGVPVAMMPLDCTQLKLDEVKRAVLFRQATAITYALSALYYQWGQPTPTLFDPMTLASMLKPAICPLTPMHIRVDDQGYTRREDGTPNAQVCLHSDQDAFFRLYLSRMLATGAPK
jgi:inosine-uridine nucleoside N-ribohydrolase